MIKNLNKYVGLIGCSLFIQLWVAYVSHTLRFLKNPKL